MIGHFLSIYGYDVDDAKNGKLALEKVAAHPPQLSMAIQALSRDTNAPDRSSAKGPTF